jgi:hypothetical protein
MSDRKESAGFFSPIFVPFLAIKKILGNSSWNLGPAYSGRSYSLSRSYSKAGIGKTAGVPKCEGKHNSA